MSVVTYSFLTWLLEFVVVTKYVTPSNFVPSFESVKLICKSNGSFATHSFPIVINAWFSLSVKISVVTFELNCLSIFVIFPSLKVISIKVIAVTS